MGACSSSKRPNAYGTSEPEERKTEGGGSSDSDAALILPAVHSGEAVFDVTPISPSAFLTAADDRCIAAWDWKEATVTNMYTGHAKSVNSVAYHGASNRFASASRDLSVKVWAGGAAGGSTGAEAGSGASAAAGPLHSLTGHTLNVSAVDWNTDGSRLVSGSRDTSVRVWDPATGAAVSSNSLPRNLVTCLEWLPGDSTVFAQGSEDLHVRLWDTRVGVRAKVVNTLGGYVYFPLDLSVSTDGNYLVTSSKGFDGVGCEGRLWDLRTGTTVTEYIGHKQDNVACAFLPGEGPVARVITASKDNTVRVWDRDAGTCLTEFNQPAAGCFTALAVLPTEPGDTSGVVTVVATTFASHVMVLTVSPDNAIRCIAQTAPSPPM